MSPTRLPLYIQISEMLHREISAGYWQPGERLPTESELSKRLDVSVGTLRKAVTKLEQEGFLIRKQGSGTYVNKPPSGAPIYKLFRLERHAGGGVPRALTLSVDAVAQAQIAERLDSQSPSLWRIRRLRLLDQAPAALEEIWIDGRHAEHLERQDLHESLYVHYRDHFQLWIDRVDDAVSVGQVPEWRVPEFGLAVGASCGYVLRHAWSQQNALEEVSFTWFDPQVACYAARWS